MNIEKELEKEKRRLLFIKNHYKILNIRNAYVCKVINKLYSFKKIYQFALGLITSCMSLDGPFNYNYEKIVLTIDGLECTSVNSEDEDALVFNEPYYILDDKQFYRQTFYADFDTKKIDYYFTLSKNDLDSILNLKKTYVTSDGVTLGLSYTTYEKHKYIDEKKILVTFGKYIFFLTFDAFLLGLGDSLFIADFIKKINDQYAELDESALEMIDNYLYMIEENINALGGTTDETRKRRVKQNS